MWNYPSSFTQYPRMLETHSRIAGDCEPISFVIMSGYNSKFDLKNCTIEWTMTNKDRTVVLSKSSALHEIYITDNVCDIKFEYDDTSELSGIYIHELKITNKYGDVYIPCQGRIEIIKKL